MISSFVIASSLAYLLPPPQFAHKPEGLYWVHRVSIGELAAKCDYDHDLYACTYPQLRQVFIRDDLKGLDYEIVLSHEYAHLNGWSHR